jgi:alpha-beta hydrolase superfamily lysophospholipase
MWRLAVLIVALAGCGGATAPPASERVHFSATDGEPVSARLTPAGPQAPTVVLVYDHSPHWTTLVPVLHDAGYATLAHDVRRSPLESERVKDTLGAVRWLRARGDTRIALFGDGLGASSVVLAAARDPRIAATIALSPIDTPDVWTLQDAGRYHPHDLLLISDRAGAAAPDSMLDGAERSRVLRSREAGYGMGLLDEERVRSAVLAWLDERVGG